MSSLSISDKSFVGEYIKKHSGRCVTGISLLIAGAISVVGLALFMSSVLITLRNLSDYVMQWVLLPGGLGGFFLMMVGVGLLLLQRKQAEEQRLCSILRKIVEGENPTSRMQATADSRA